MNTAWINRVALMVTVIGFSQMAGYLAGIPALRGIGAASCVAPCPKVFSDMSGFEPFASDFALRGRWPSGELYSLAITPEVYARVGGCYNRRNVYGAALCAGPRLPEPLWRAVFEYGFRADGPLRQEIGIPGDITDLSVEIITKTRGRNDRWTLAFPCKP